MTAGRRAPVPAWQVWEARFEAASLAELPALHEERRAAWRAAKAAAGLDPDDCSAANTVAGIRALMAAEQVSEAHGAMMRRAMGAK